MPTSLKLRLPVLAALFGLVCGCQPADRSGSVDAYVFELVPGTRSYHVTKARVDNLESLAELRGTWVDMRAGAELADLNATVPELDRGEPFRFEFELDSDGTVIPGDTHSLYGISFYRTLDRVTGFFLKHGFTPDRRMDVYYFPFMDELLFGDFRWQMGDNAAFFGEGFLLQPAFVLGDIPFLLNEGVVAHEFGHLVVQQTVFGSSTAAPELETCVNNHTMALHEAAADLVGFAFTGDPDFMTATVEDPRVFDDPKLNRDLRVARPLTFAEYSALCPPGEGESPVDVDPHFQGSTLARAIYQAWPKQNGAIPAAERERMAGVLLAALRHLGPGNQPSDMVQLADAMAAQMPAAERPAFCAVLRTQLSPASHVLGACGNY